MIEAHILKLPTSRLLAYYKKHYQMRYGRVSNNYNNGNITEKEYNTFMADYDVLKKELDKREHVEK